MIQLLEVAIAGVVSITLASLWFASNMVPKPRLTPEARAEKRAILQRQRDMWFKSWSSRRDPDDWQEVMRLDRELFELANDFVTGPTEGAEK